MSSQLDMAIVYASLYDPIVGASDGHGRPTKTTDQDKLERTFALKQAYTDLRNDLVDGINSIETDIIRPALDARTAIAPIRKTIKKRENKRLDLEKCQDRVHKLHRKMPRTPKEDAQLAKSEDELANLNEVRQPGSTWVTAHKLWLGSNTRSRNSRLPTPTCARHFRQLFRLRSVSSHLSWPHISGSKTSCWAYTTPICTVIARAWDFSRPRLPWIR